MRDSLSLPTETKVESGTFQRKSGTSVKLSNIGSCFIIIVITIVIYSQREVSLGSLVVTPSKVYSSGYGLRYESPNAASAAVFCEFCAISTGKAPGPDFRVIF